MRKSGKKAYRKKRFRRWKFLAGLVFFFAVAGFAGLAYLYNTVSANIPDVMGLKNYSPSLITTIYDINSRRIAQFYVEKRILKSLNEIPLLARQASIAIEDDNFYNHHGIDFAGIARAAWVDLKAGAIVQGGSTITQQVAKLIFLTQERTFKRKFRELLLALQIERYFTKDEILEIYLNQIYYGHGAYGIEAASQMYFGKSADELTLGEMALLAGLPKAPSHFSPFKNPTGAIRRRNIVIGRMEKLGYITPRQATQARNEQLRLAPKVQVTNLAPYFAEHVRRQIEKEYGATKLYHEGLNIYTTLDLDWQEKAQTALRKGIETTDRRLGYRGPAGWVNPAEEIDWDEINPSLGRLPKSERFKPGKIFRAVVQHVGKEEIFFSINGDLQEIGKDGFGWAHPADTKKDGRWAKKIRDARTIGLNEGDIIEVRAVKNPKSGGIRYHLAQTPTVQGALLGIDYTTGAVRAMVGGYDFQQSSFNRAIQARRQPGSSFKPIIYAAAIDKGLTAASVIIDAPLIFEDEIGEFKNWKPVNFTHKFFGPTTVREAVTHSRNIVTIKVLRHIGVPYAAEYAKRIGIHSPLDRNLSLALGTSSVTLREMVSTYGVFANGGVRNEPYFIERIENSAGQTIAEHTPAPSQVMPPDTAYIINSIMQSVVQEGTGKKVKVIGVPAGGKTGTTNDFLDTWFIGFTPGMVCGVWVGKDREEVLGKNETGSRAAAPIWLDFMKEVVQVTPNIPFTPPKDVVFVRTDKKTGALAMPDNPNSIFEVFKETDIPQSYEPANPLF